MPTFFRAPIRSNSQQLSHQLAALEASSFFWGYCEWVIACLWCFSKDDGDGGIRPNHVHVCIYVSHFNFVSLCECIYIFIYIYICIRTCVCVCCKFQSIHASFRIERMSFVSQVSEGQNTDARQAGRKFVIWIVSRRPRMIH